MKKLQYTLLAVVAAILFTSCEKVSPIGVLVAGTGVEDRVKMSNIYFKQHKMEYKDLTAPEDADEYTFLVGSDSHVTDDPGRMDEMFSIGIEGKDLLYAHLGDIADTKAEYYINLDNSIQRAKEMYADKFYKKEVVEDEGIMYTKYTDTLNNQVYFDTEDVPLPFFPVVGNHDITHNGWALWSSLFHSSFYEVYVLADITSDDTYLYDHFIFLDTASGTLGREQVELIEQGVFDSMYDQEIGMKTRHTFIFSHTNIFRPRAVEFASTFAREEMFFLLDKFAEWNASMVFLGHVHKWDYEKVNGVEYLTLDSMCEANNPNPGDYLVRVHCKKDGTITWERVRMNYTKKR
jgi:predicted phosphodiesterase